MNTYESKAGHKVVVNRKEDTINIFDKPESQGGKVTEYKKVGSRTIVPVTTPLITSTKPSPATVTGPLPTSTSSAPAK